MGNMSYCRFQNTAIDMADCAQAILEMVDGCHGEISSDEKEGMVRLFSAIGEMMNHIQSHTGKDMKEQADEMVWGPREFTEWFLKSLPEESEDEESEDE